MVGPEEEEALTWKLHLQLELAGTISSRDGDKKRNSQVGLAKLEGFGPYGQALDRVLLGSQI